MTEKVDLLYRKIAALAYEVDLSIVDDIRVTMDEIFKTQHMSEFRNMSDIDLNTREGRYLSAAIAILTTQKKLILLKEKVNGRKTTPNFMLEAVGKLEKIMYADATPIPTDVMEQPITFQEALQQLINKYSMENGSNTPDFILAKYLVNCLVTFEAGIHFREKWYGVYHSPGEVLGMKEAKPEPLFKPDYKSA